MKNVAVIGAGTMGNGIAHVFAQFNHQVHLIDVSQAALDKAILTIEKNLDRQVAKEANEGVLDALKRELQEELSAEMLDSSFFYFNDFEQVSAFDPSQQLVAFYYLVRLKEPEKIGTRNYSIPFQEETEKQRWVYIHELNEKDFTFPIDQIVLVKLKESLIS